MDKRSTSTSIFAIQTCSLLKKGKSRFTFGLNAAENTHYSEKSLKKKLYGFKFRTKSAKAYVYLSPSRVELGGSKYDMVEILNCTKMEKYIHFWAERCRKDALF